MQPYDPLKTLDAAEWQELDEGERLELVMKYHRDADEELPDGVLHATIHVIVENQVALGVEPVPATLARLMRQGLDRHEAIHAIGSVLAGQIYEVLDENASDVGVQAQYGKRLEKLTAKRWLDGKW